MSSGGKRANGWHEMARKYTHNIVPEPPVVTGWDSVIEACSLTEDQAREFIATDPHGKVAKKIKREVVKDKAYNDRYFPEWVLKAFGLLTEVNGRAECGWRLSRPNRKAQCAQGRRDAAKQAAEVRP